MKVRDLLTAIRSHLQDEVEPYLWSDEELLSYLNDTLKNDITKFYPFLMFYDTLTTAEGVASYPLNLFVYTIDSVSTSLPIYQILSIQCEQRKLIKTESVPNLLHYNTSKGFPLYFYWDSLTSTLSLFPTPDDEYSLLLKLWCLHNTISYQELDDAVIVLPDYFRPLILYGVYRYAFSKSDDETNSKQSEYYRLLFEKELAMKKRDFVRDNAELSVSYVHRGLL